MALIADGFASENALIFGFFGNIPEEAYLS